MAGMENVSPKLRQTATSFLKKSDLDEPSTQYQEIYCCSSSHQAILEHNAHPLTKYPLNKEQTHPSEFQEQDVVGLLGQIHRNFPGGSHPGRPDEHKMVKEMLLEDDPDTGEVVNADMNKSESESRENVQKLDEVGENMALTELDALNEGIDNTKTEIDAMTGMEIRQEVHDAKKETNVNKGIQETKPELYDKELGAAKKDLSCALKDLDDARKKIGKATKEFGTVKIEIAAGKKEHGNREEMHDQQEQDNTSKKLNDAKNKLNDAVIGLLNAKTQLDKAKTEFDAMTGMEIRQEVHDAKMETNVNKEIQETKPELDDKELGAAKRNLSDALRYLDDARKNMTTATEELGAVTVELAAEEKERDDREEICDQQKQDDTSKKLNGAKKKLNDAMMELSNAKTQLDGAKTEFDFAKTKIDDATKDLEDANVKFGRLLLDQNPTLSERSTGNQTTDESKECDQVQIMVDVLEFYSRTLQGLGKIKSPTPIDHTMSIGELICAHQDVIVKVSFPHVLYMIQNIQLLKFGQSLLKEIDVTEIAEELLQKANSRLHMANEMLFILYLCMNHIDTTQSKYCELEMKLLDELKLSPRKQQKLTKLEKALGDAKTELEYVTGMEIRQEVHDAKMETNVNKEIQETKPELDDKELGAAKKNLSEALRYLDDARKNMTKATKELDAVKVELAAEEKERHDREEIHDQQKQDDTSKKLNDGRTELSDAKTKLEDSKTELDGAKTKIDDAKTELDCAKSKIDDAKTELYCAKSKLDDAKTEFDGAKTKIGDAKKELENAIVKVRLLSEQNPTLSETGTGNQTTESEEFDPLQICEIQMKSLHELELSPKKQRKVRKPVKALGNAKTELDAMTGMEIRKEIHGQWEDGQWGGVKAMYEGAKLPQLKLNRKCIWAAIKEDWAGFLDCVANGANLIQTSDTREYQEKLGHLANEKEIDQCQSSVTFPAWEKFSPLHIAIRTGHCPMEKLDQLISIDKELANAVDLSGDSLLHAAVQGLDAKTVKVLCRCGVDVNIKDSQGRTALQHLMSEATKIVAAHNMDRLSNKPNVDAMATGKESCEKPNVMLPHEVRKMPQEMDMSSECDHSNNCTRQLAKIVDVMATMVNAAGIAGQTIEWPSGDNGWTALHIVCAAGGYQHLKIFVKFGADPHALRDGNTLIDTVVWQDHLTVDQQMKTLDVLVEGLELMEFHAEVVNKKIMEKVPSHTSHEHSAQMTSKGSTKTCATDSVNQKSGDNLPPDDSAFLKDKNVFHVPGEHETDTTDLEYLEKLMKMDNIASLRDSSLLTTMVHNVQVGEVRSDKLAETLLTEDPMDKELMELLKMLERQNDPHFKPLFEKLASDYKPVRTVEEAFNKGDYLNVLKAYISHTPLSKRELTIVMLVAAQRGKEKVFYDCLQRGGSLTGIDSEDDKTDKGEPENEMECDSVSSSASSDKYQTIETKTKTKDINEDSEKPDEDTLPGESPNVAQDFETETICLTGKSEAVNNFETQKSTPIPSPLEEAIQNPGFCLSKLAKRTGNLFEACIQSANRNGRSLLHSHVNRYEISRATMENVTRLLSHGADFNAKNDQGMTMLQTMILLKGSEVMVKLVRKAVDCGQSIDWSPAKNSWTALHVLAAKGAFEHIPFFVEHGADPKVLRRRTCKLQRQTGSVRKLKDDREHENEKMTLVETGLQDEEDGIPNQPTQRDKPVDDEKDGNIVTDGLTLIDTVLLQHNLNDERKFLTLRTLLKDLHLGPYHAQIVDKRPKGQYKEFILPHSQYYRYPLDYLLQPSTVTPQTKRTILELVQLMVKYDAMGEVEKAVILDKIEEFRKLPFCQPVVNFLEAMVKNM